MKNLKKQKKNFVGVIPNEKIPSAPLGSRKGCRPSIVGPTVGSACGPTQNPCRNVTMCRRAIWARWSGRWSFPKATDHQNEEFSTICTDWAWLRKHHRADHWRRDRLRIEPTQECNNVPPGHCGARWSGQRWYIHRADHRFDNRPHVGPMFFRNDQFNNKKNNLFIMLIFLFPCHTEWSSNVFGWFEPG